MLDDRRVDQPGRLLPGYRGTLVRPSRDVDCVPGPPLASREGPRVALAQHVLQLALVPHRVPDVAAALPRGGPLEAVGVDVGVAVPVEVDELERAEVDAVGTERPGAVEGLGVE